MLDGWWTIDAIKASHASLARMGRDNYFVKSPWQNIDEMKRVFATGAQEHRSTGKRQSRMGDIVTRFDSQRFRWP